MTYASRLSIVCALSAAAMASAAVTASAQTSTTSSSDGVLTTSSTATTMSKSTATATKRKPTSATAEMVNEAIQRSEARAAKELQTGVPQKWGSEEPFTYNSTVRRFNANQQ
jgi:hypothetical protein